MKKIILLIIGFLTTICISFASVAEYDNLIDKYTNNPSERVMLKYIMRMESMGNSNAKNPGSSATGAFQILKDTWTQAVNEGKKQGLFTSKEAKYLLAHPEMRKDPVASTKAAIALNRFNRKNMGGTTAIKQILAYHDGSIKNRKNPTGTFDGATLEGRKYVIKANEMYKLQNGGKNMPGFDEYVKNSKTYQKWLRDGTVAKIQKDAKSRLSGKYSMENGEITESELDRGAAAAVNYKPTKPINLDSLEQTILGYFLKGAKNVAKVGIFILSVFFGIQVIFDCIVGMSNNNLKAIVSGILLKRGLNFTFYLMMLKKIIDGSLAKTMKEIAKQLVVCFTNTSMDQPLTAVWNLKEDVLTAIFAGITKAWDFSWLNLNIFQTLSRFATALILTIILLLVAIYVCFTFFRIILDLFKLMLSIDIGLTLGSVLIGLGMLDATRQYYSISKIISICLNYVLKFSSITILFYVSMKILRESSNLINGNLSADAIFSSPLMSYLLVLFIVYKLITSVKIEF